jgi:hypothetical protein
MVQQIRQLIIDYNALLLFGLVFALPFIGIKLYAARVSLSVMAALLAYWGLVGLARSHGGANGITIMLYA